MRKILQNVRKNVFDFLFLILFLLGGKLLSMYLNYHFYGSSWLSLRSSHHITQKKTTHYEHYEENVCFYDYGQNFLCYCKATGYFDECCCLNGQYFDFQAFKDRMKLFLSSSTCACNAALYYWHQNGEKISEKIGVEK